jgi:hypothetical protein
LQGNDYIVRGMAVSETSTKPVNLVEIDSPNGKYSRLQDRTGVVVTDEPQSSYFKAEYRALGLQTEAIHIKDSSMWHVRVVNPDDRKTYTVSILCPDPRYNRSAYEVLVYNGREFDEDHLVIGIPGNINRYKGIRIDNLLPQELSFMQRMGLLGGITHASEIDSPMAEHDKVYATEQRRFNEEVAELRDISRRLTERKKLVDSLYTFDHLVGLKSARQLELHARELYEFNSEHNFEWFAAPELWFWDIKNVVPPPIAVIHGRKRPEIDELGAAIPAKAGEPTPLVIHEENIRNVVNSFEKASVVNAPVGGWLTSKESSIYDKTKVIEGLCLARTLGQRLNIFSEYARSIIVHEYRHAYDGARGEEPTFDKTAEAYYHRLAHECIAYLTEMVTQDIPLSILMRFSNPERMEEAVAIVNGQDKSFSALLHRSDSGSYEAGTLVLYLALKRLTGCDIQTCSLAELESALASLPTCDTRKMRELQHDIKATIDRYTQCTGSDQLKWLSESMGLSEVIVG